MRKSMIWLLVPLTLVLIGCSDSSGPDDDNGDDDPIDRVVTTVLGDGFMTVFDISEQAADEWTWFLFSTGEDVQRTDSWDFSLHFANFNVNGGSHGSGGVELLWLDGDGFDDLDQAPAGDYVADMGDDDAGRAFNQGTDEYNGGWYNYNYQTHAMTLNPNRYYVIRTVDGDYVKFRITDFVWNNDTQAGYPESEWGWIDAP